MFKPIKKKGHYLDKYKKPKHNRVPKNTTEVPTKIKKTKMIDFKSSTFTQPTKSISSKFSTGTTNTTSTPNTTEIFTTFTMNTTLTTTTKNEPGNKSRFYVMVS